MGELGEPCWSGGHLTLGGGHGGSAWLHRASFCPPAIAEYLPYLGVPLEGIKSSGYQDQLGLELKEGGVT